MSEYENDQTNEPVVEAVVLQESALSTIIGKEFDVAIATAKKFPRDLAQCKKTTLQLAAADKETAESCFFKLPRKKKNEETGKMEDATIEGESIRLAEIVATSWKNLKFATRIISIDRIGKKITAQAVVHDLENNTSASVEETKNIVNKFGKIYTEDMIVMTGRAAQSVALRNAIFKVVPKAFFRNIIKEITAVAIGEKPGYLDDAKNFKKEPLPDRIKKAVKFFVNFAGIPEARIFHALSVKSMDEMTEEHLITLTGIRSGVQNGEFTIASAFPLTEEDRSKEVGKEILNKVNSKNVNEPADPPSTATTDIRIHSSFNEVAANEFLFQVIGEASRVLDSNKKQLIAFADNTVGMIKDISVLSKNPDEITELRVVPVNKKTPFTKNVVGSIVTIYS